MLKAGTNLAAKSDKELIDGDAKSFDMAGRSVRIGQINTVDLCVLDRQAGEKKCKRNGGWWLWFVHHVSHQLLTVTQKWSLPVNLSQWLKAFVRLWRITGLVFLASFPEKASGATTTAAFNA